MLTGLLYYISERDMSVEQKNHEFYMTLTPTSTSKLSRTKYEKLMSDFETQLRKPIKLNPNMKWRATLLNAFIPIDLSLVKSASYTNYWFQYVWGEQKRLAGLPLFEEKHYFISEGDHFQEFCNVFNTNSRGIGNDMSLCKLNVPLIISSDEFGKMKIEFTKDIPVKSIIGFRMNAGFAKQFLGVADSEFQQISVRRALFRIVFNNSLIYIPYRITENKRYNSVDVLFTNVTRVIKKGTIATCRNKVLTVSTNDEINRRVDVEVSIIASNKLSGSAGHIIRSVTQNASDVNTEVDESRQTMFLPIEINEFSYIHCRLVHHVNKQLLQYKYDAIVGRPLLVLKISPDNDDEF